MPNNSVSVRMKPLEGCGIGVSVAVVDDVVYVRITNEPLSGPFIEAPFEMKIQKGNIQRDEIPKGGVKWQDQKTIR